MAEDVQVLHTARPVQIAQDVDTAAAEGAAEFAGAVLPGKPLLKASLKNTNLQILIDLQNLTPVNLQKFLSMR